jgi:hypothetical protein
MYGHARNLKRVALSSVIQHGTRSLRSSSWISQHGGDEEDLQTTGNDWPDSGWNG